MTKEQEAIEYFKKNINYFKEQIKFIEAVDCDYYDEEYELYKNRVKQFETVLSMIEKRDKQIDLMATTLSAICTGLSTVREQFEKSYCEFINSDKDCCWKTDTNCKDCIKQYFERRSKE